MGSATREALSQAKIKLTALAGSIDLDTGESLFAAGRVIGSSGQLRALISDPSSEPATRAAVVNKVFSGSIGEQALGLLSGAASDRWSTPDDLLAGIEELGLRAVAASAPAGVSVDSELFALQSAIATNADLELALGSKLGQAASKVAVVNSLLAGKSSPQTLTIVTHLVQQPRGRRIGELLTHAATVVADQAGHSIATVTSATPLAAAQLDRLAKGLARVYGRELRINQIVNPDLLGGLRVQVGDDVIDGSISQRLNDLRLALAG